MPSSRMRSIFLIQVALLCAVLLPTVTRAELVTKVLATVDGEPITTFEIDTFLAQRTQGQTLPAGFRADSPQVLDAYITEKLIQKEVSDQGIVVTVQRGRQQSKTYTWKSIFKTYSFMLSADFDDGDICVRLTSDNVFPADRSRSDHD